MRNAIQYTTGEIIGNNNITFIREMETRRVSNTNIRYAMFKCHCGNIFKTSISSIRTGHSTSCGCIKIKMLVDFNTTHKMYKTSTYRVWDCIRERTGNIKNPSYENYGGRGVIMFPPWIHDFQLFYDYVSALPNYGVKGYKLDRTDNDGSYEPGNLRWVTSHIQNTNKRMDRKNTSGYTGVTFYKRRWVSQLGLMGKNIYLGRFKTMEQAVTARNNYIIANKLFEYKIQTIIS